MKKASVFLACCALACVSISSPAIADRMEIDGNNVTFQDETVTLNLSQRERVVIEAEVTAIDKAPSNTGTIRARVTINGDAATATSHYTKTTRTREGTAKLIFVVELSEGSHEIKLLGLGSQEAAITGGNMEVRVLGSLRR